MSLKKKRSSSKNTLTIFLLLVVAGLCGAGFILFFEGFKPVIDMSRLPEYLASKDRLSFALTDRGSGLRRIEVQVEQNGTSQQIFSTENPRTRYLGQVGPAELETVVDFDAKSLGFKDGEVTVTMTVSDFSFRGLLSGNTSVESRSLKLDTIPPKVTILHGERYISPGGAGVVIYQNSDVTGNHGVLVNGKFSRGYPVDDGRKDTFIAYFALPYDTETIEQSAVRAEDVAGNSSTIPFSMTLKKVQFNHDQIHLSDNFLNAKIPEFEQHYDTIHGSLTEKYLVVNRDIRQANNAKITELCRNTGEKRLWKGRFLRMPGSTKANFADHRTYLYQGQEIDHQVHLGVDLASTQNVEIRAANSGKVLFADYLGIYGNMVMLDHGQGIVSLYSHLSQISAQTGEMVAQGDVIGQSGTSGMAGGDHLHFSMLVHGVFVTPKEWWDSHWIEVSIDQPLLESKF